MLTAEQNERLTRVSAGTPMGDLMRRYWQPFMPSAKLLENPVQKFRLLGEDLVVYRDRSGKLGIVGDRCAHRLVSLEYGIPEEDGLRCPYHGWCYNARGECTDQPMESPNSRMKDRIKIPAYPVAEMGGLLFAYLGPGPAPLLPTWELFTWPNAIRQIAYTELPCNWLQCHENASDPTHSPYLHGHFFRYVLDRQGYFDLTGTDPRTHLSTRLAGLRGISHVISEMDEFGLQKAVVYKEANGADRDYTRWHSATIFPHMVRVGGVGSIRQEYQIRVPIDDETTWHLAYQCYIAPEGVEVPPQDEIPYYHAPIIDETGKPILDYVLAQDMVAWASQGRITDRTREHLGGGDAAIVAFRKLLEEQLQLVEGGGDPMNVFRDPDAMPSILRSKPLIGEQWDARDASSAVADLRNQSLADDVDRYGPLDDMVSELYDRIHRYLNDERDVPTSVG